MNVEGKKILILGANAETIPIVQAAQAMGVQAIVTDHIIGSPAKKVADNYYDIDGKNVEAIVKLIKENGIDGVIVGVADPLVEAYVKICNELGYPCLTVGKNIKFFKNKTIFKEECKKNNISVVREFFRSFEITDIDEKKLQFPMVVKPAEGHGGCGITYCEDFNNFENAYKLAQKKSDNNEVIGEEYISAEDVVVTFMCAEGRTELLAMTDRILLKSDNKISTVTYSNNIPSKYWNIFKERNLEKYRNLFKSLNIRNGIINIQMFRHNNMFIPYDLDCILNGEYASRFLESVLGIDIVGKFIMYALTGDEKILSFEESYPQCLGASVWILLKAGVIKKIEGIDRVAQKEYVIDSLWRMQEGQKVTEEMRYTEKAVLGRVWIVGKNQAEIRERVREIRTLIKTRDMKDNNMLEDV